MTDKPICDVWFEQLTDDQRKLIMGFPVDTTPENMWHTLGMPERWTIYFKHAEVETKIEIKAEPVEVPKEETIADVVVETETYGHGALVQVSATINDDGVVTEIDPLAIWESEDDPEAETVADEIEHKIEATDVQTVELSSLKYNELQKMAKNLGINPWGKKKQVLIDLISEA